MNSSIISHRMFVAALAHDAYASEKQPSIGRVPKAADTKRSDTTKPATETPAARGARPWVNWPVVAIMEARSAS